MQQLDPRIIEQFEQRAGFSLPGSLIALFLVGSDSHGTKIPDANPHGIDDTDYMGVYIPPPAYTLGLKNGHKHASTVQFQFEELDCVFYSLRHFIELLVKSNPNVLGSLWLRPQDYIYHTQEWFDVMQHRAMFSSARAYPAFSGYAYGQAKKMVAFNLEIQQAWEDSLAITGAAGWPKDRIIQGQHLDMPNFKALVEMINSNRPLRMRLLDQWNLSHDPTDDSKLFDVLTENLQAVLEAARKKVHSVHAQHFQGYMGDKRKHNVIQHGYDVKNAAHLIRLMAMCVEFLGGDAGNGPGVLGEFQVYRTKDAQKLMDIKSGKWTLDKVHAEAERLTDLAKASLENAKLLGLPEEPDVERANALLIELTRNRYGWVPPTASA